MPKRGTRLQVAIEAAATHDAQLHHFGSFAPPPFPLRTHKILCFLQDVEPGLPVRSQLAAPALSVKAAFDKMKGDPFVVETKFDGRLKPH